MLNFWMREFHQISVSTITSKSINSENKLQKNFNFLVGSPTNLSGFSKIRYVFSNKFRTSFLMSFLETQNHINPHTQEIIHTVRIIPRSTITGDFSIFFLSFFYTFLQDSCSQKKQYRLQNCAWSLQPKLSRDVRKTFHLAPFCWYPNSRRMWFTVSQCEENKYYLDKNT